MSQDPVFTEDRSSGNHNKTCIIIAGPTAVGKTALSIELAKHYQTSIVSADSRQCYRELNIGVAKPDATQLSAVTHYFVNSHQITEEVNAAIFEAYALNALDEIFRKADYAIVTGGTGLYIKALCDGMDGIPQVPTSVRQAVTTEYENRGLSWLQQEVQLTDPEYFNSGEINNPQRLMRALEVKRFTGSSIVSFHSYSKKQRPFNIIKVGLELPRTQLYDNIDQRVDRMMSDGLLEEAAALFPHCRLTALQTVGYKEIFEFITGRITLPQAVVDIKKHTRHYAKRQLTWFKKDEAMKWFAPGDFDVLKRYLQDYN